MYICVVITAIAGLKLVTDFLITTTTKGLRTSAFR